MATITLQQQAEEVVLSSLEYADFIKNVRHSKDPRAQRPPEQIEWMEMRLERKRAAAETLQKIAQKESGE